MTTVPATFALTALVAFAGSFIQSASGFGYAIICMSFWPLIMPFRTASILEAVTAFFMVVYLTVRLWKHIDWKLLLPPLILSVAFSFLGVNTLMSLSDTALRRILGAALLLLACYFVFFSKRVHLRPNIPTGVGAGVISGFCSGLFNIGGPPMVAYFLSVTEDKQVYNATLQAFFCVNTVALFFIHVFKGNVTADMLPLGGCALLGTALGTLTGFLLFKRLTLTGVRTFVYIFMTLAGLSLLLFS